MARLQIASTYFASAFAVFAGWNTEFLHAGTPALQSVEVAGGFSQPVDIQSPADGTNRLFIVERSGVIKILKGGVIFATPFLDISDRVHDGLCRRGFAGFGLPGGFRVNRPFLR